MDLGERAINNDHPPVLKKKKNSSFSAWVSPAPFQLSFPHYCPASNSNLVAKQNQQGNYISNFSRNLDSMVTLHLVLLTSWGGNWCPLLLEEVNYTPLPAPGPRVTSWHSILFVGKRVSFFIIFLLTPEGSDFIDLKVKSPEFQRNRLFKITFQFWPVKRCQSYCWLPTTPFQHVAYLPIKNFIKMFARICPSIWNIQSWKD